MTIVRFDPFRPFLRPMMEDWDINPWPNFKMTEGLDVYEEGDSVIIKAAVPGVDPSKVKITFEDGVLHIYAHEEEKEEEKNKKKMYKKERVTTFDYTCTLPRPIKQSELSATVENGVVIITAPIAPEAKPHSVPVTVKK